MYLVDCPGYIDTFGFYRIISNRFFYYHILSKVVNAKFVVTVNFADLRKTADNLKNTFSEFLNGFYNLTEIKSQIFNATSLMVTEVDKDDRVERVRETYKNTPDNLGGQSEIYAELKAHLL
jgi:hypothetical protein